MQIPIDFTDHSSVKKLTEEELILQFNQISDIRIFLLHHPDHEMIKRSCLHFLGEQYEEFDRMLIKEKK